MQLKSTGLVVCGVLLITSGFWMAGQANAAPAKAPKFKLTAASKGKTYTINKGDTFTVTLDSNPTTGYQLHMVLDGSEPFSLVSKTYKSDPNPDGAVGVGGNYTFTFKANKAGEGEVIFVNFQKFNLDTLKSSTPWNASITVK